MFGHIGRIQNKIGRDMNQDMRPKNRIFCFGFSAFFVTVEQYWKFFGNYYPYISVPKFSFKSKWENQNRNKGL
jgi:hypothetical protein